MGEMIKNLICLRVDQSVLKKKSFCLTSIYMFVGQKINQTKRVKNFSIMLQSVNLFC